MNEILEIEMPTLKKTSNLTPKKVIQIDDNINMAAPNGGKCPHCSDGYLYWSHEGTHGRQYYKCGKCGSTVLA